MPTMRTLILLAAIASCTTQPTTEPTAQTTEPTAQSSAAATGVTPSLGCSDTCSSNVECSHVASLCKYCNFGTCSQFLPSATVSSLQWMRVTIDSVVSPADDQKAPALELIDHLLAQARRTAAEAVPQ